MASESMLFREADRVEEKEKRDEYAYPLTSTVFFFSLLLNTAFLLSLGKGVDFAFVFFVATNPKKTDNET